MEKMKYYPGTKKRITDPFCILSCAACGYRTWSVFTGPKPCPRCGGAMREAVEDAG